MKREGDSSEWGNDNRKKIFCISFLIGIAISFIQGAVVVFMIKLKIVFSVVVLLAFPFWLLSGCTTNQDLIDMSETIEARSLGVSQNLLKIEIIRVYLEDPDGLEYEAYYVDISDAKYDMSIEYLSTVGVPILVIPDEPFNPHNLYFSACEIIGFNQ